VSRVSTLISLGTICSSICPVLYQAVGPSAGKLMRPNLISLKNHRDKIKHPAADQKHRQYQA
jgi:hypothetical protein